eukprot:766643-Hanusia_phi.AAC.13
MFATEWEKKDHSQTCCPDRSSPSAPCIALSKGNYTSYTHALTPSWASTNSLATTITFPGLVTGASNCSAQLCMRQTLQLSCISPELERAESDSPSPAWPRPLVGAHLRLVGGKRRSLAAAIAVALQGTW